jgi:divalent metal cation (Fe/Co/Zn/Cd) transporter
MISLDVEVDGELSLNEAHKIADEVEKSIRQSIEFVYDIVVHVEPEGKYHSKEGFGVDKKMLK